MRIANAETAIQSLSRTQNSAILLVTADPTCGDSAFQALDFLPEDAVETLRHSGTVVLRAEGEEEWSELRGMTKSFVTAFEDEKRLCGEAILFQAGTPVFQIVGDGREASRLAA
jgi:hypothetical protein